MTSEEIIRILHEVEHPGNGDKNIVDLGMVESVQTDGNKVTVNLVFPKHRDPLSEYLVGSCKAAVIRHFHEAVVEVKTSVKQAVERIKTRNVDIARITKTVLVIDEAQDMDADEYELVRMLMSVNEDIRVIAVGDDDQNIYAFRGSDSRYMKELAQMDGAVKYELVQNFRSKSNLVEFSNGYARSISNRLKEYDVEPVNSGTGELRTVYYSSRNLSVPVVESIMQTHLRGSVAVLTRTNDEALEIFNLLLNRGMPVKLIQSNDGFKLSALAEIRYFMDMLHIREEGAVIEEEDWEKAKAELYSAFSRSDKMEVCHNLIKSFEATDRKTKYKSDFETFVNESALEDFIEADTSTVVVSTMHKAKGKEFDNVFLILIDPPKDDQDRRLLYVALTRAKNNLYIHTCTSSLVSVKASGLQNLKNMRQYLPSGERTLLLTLKDVWLSDSSSRQSLVSALMSGDRLYADANGCRDSAGKTVLKFSNGFKNRLADFVHKGYSVEEAKVNFVVWWKGDGMDKEIRIVLPELHLVNHAVK